MLIGFASWVDEITTIPPPDATNAVGTTYNNKTMTLKCKDKQIACEGDYQYRLKADTGVGVAIRNKGFAESTAQISVNLDLMEIALTTEGQKCGGEYFHTKVHDEWTGDELYWTPKLDENGEPVLDKRGHQIYKPEFSFPQEPDTF